MLSTAVCSTKKNTQSTYLQSRVDSIQTRTEMLYLPGVKFKHLFREQSSPNEQYAR
jgi:hypothetical protein